MTSKEALKKIYKDYRFREKIESGYIYHTELPFMEAVLKIEKDLKELEKLKKKKLNKNKMRLKNDK